MQARYACDIGDFAKYSLLGSIAGADLRLGVIWYLNPVEESNTDGRFTEYPELRECNDQLYDALQTLLQKGERSLSSIERGGILPAGTKFFSKPLPTGSHRQNWSRDAATAVAGTEVVFLDPDNGLPESAEAWRRDSRKYASLEELISFRTENRSVVLYQHQTRSGSFEKQLERHCRSIRGLGADEVWALSFHRRSVRGFLVVPAPRHVELLKERCRRFILSRWGREEHFRFRVHQQDERDSATTVAEPKTMIMNTPSKKTRTTDPGYTNRNGQTVIRATPIPCNDHFQRTYVLRCGSCLREYGANGSDIFQRRCPWCQSGRPGLPIR